MLLADFFGVVIASIYFVIMVEVYILLCWKKIWNSIELLICHYRRIRSRNFYYIIDNKKKKEKDSRKAWVNELNSLSGSAYIIVFLVLAAISTLLSKQMGAVEIVLIMIFGSVMIWGAYLWLLYRIPWVSYIIFVTMPFILAIIITSAKYNISNINLWITTICVMSAIIFQTFFVVMTPIFLLHSLKSKILLVSAIITIISALISLIISAWIQSRIPAFEMNTVYAELVNGGYLSDSLVAIVDENKIIVEDIMKYVYERIGSEYVSTVESVINLSFWCISLGNIIGNIAINVKLSWGKKRASKLFRDVMIKSDYDYSNLVEIAYLGGSDYEDLLLNNETAKGIILEKEF